MPEYDNTNRGILFINDRKTEDKHPDFKGSINVGGVEYWVSGWNKDTTKGKAVSLSVQPKEKKEGAASAGFPTPSPHNAATQAFVDSQKTSAEVTEDEIPF